MMKHTVLFLGLLLAPTAATAGTNITCTPSGICVLNKTTSAEPHVIHVPAAQEGDAVEHSREWLARCNPRVWTDPYGVERIAYAQPGCDVGRQ